MGSGDHGDGALGGSGEFTSMCLWISWYEAQENVRNVAGVYLFRAHRPDT